MEVKPGYKQTEVGVIPEEWDVKLLPEVCRFRSGKAHEQYVSDLGRYVCVNSKFISTDGEVRKYVTANFCPAKKNDVMLVMSDLPNGRALAKAYLAEQDDIYAVNQRVCALTAYRDCAKYLFWALNRNPYFLRFDDGVNQTHLLNHVFQKCPIVLPREVPEQRAIATALSDMDALLGGLERLIDKKRDLKQAAMQQLLTGRTRLPGFHGEWKVKRLGEVFDISAGTSKSAFITAEGDYWICDMGSVSTDGRLIVSKRTNYKGDFLCLGDLVMPRDDIGGGKIIGKVGYIDADSNYVLSDHVYRLRAREGDARFLAYTINSHTINSALRKKVIGSAQLGLGRKSVEEQDILFPAPREQSAIAAVLSDMDTELEALKTRRDKTRALKQAMMQELLTGKTRLVPAGGAHA
jgi:type I restriction enzyme S subunit